MILLIEIMIFFGVFLLWWINQDRKRYSHYPPGPPRLPLVGNIPHVMLKSHFPAISFRKLGDTYGDVMFLKLGANEAVVFNSGDSIHELLTHEKALGRTQFQVIRERHNNKNLGIIWGYGKPWQNLRRFTMRNLRDFGFGKSVAMDAVVNEEIDKFTEHIKCEAAKAPNNIIHHVEDLFSLTVVNVLWRLVSGRVYEYNDPKMLRLLQLNSDFFRSSNFGLDFGDAFPILREWFPVWSRKTLQRQTSQDLYDYGKELLEEQRQLGTSNTEPQSFIDVFAAKVEDSVGNPDTDFTDEQFIMTILDLLVAGSETSSNTLSFGILYMILNPQVQNKVQEEIDQVVPEGVDIDSSMRSKLPYTCATILEIFRYSTIAPTPAPREASEDFYFRGYFIKKGTSLVTNVHATHFNEKVWGDPLKFRPERFLTSSGTEIDQKVADKLNSFGAGKRYCLGQSLAETTIFLYFASVMRRFAFSMVGTNPPSAEPVLGITTVPQPFSVQVIERRKLE